MLAATILGGVRPAAAQPRLLRPDGGAAAPNARLESAVALFLSRGGAGGPTAVGARPVAVSLATAAGVGGGGGGFVGREP
jgi:hypothetical protein